MREGKRIGERKMPYKNKEDKKEYNKKYRQANTEKIKKQKHKYYLTHKKETAIYNKNYYATYKGKAHEYYLTHREEKATYNKQYKQANRERMNANSKGWNKEHPERVRERVRKEQHKRRGLGHLPINKHFKGAVFHHLDRDAGIYIPEWLHKACYPHNVWTGKGMDKANETAIRWWMIHQCKELQGDKK